MVRLFLKLFLCNRFTKERKQEIKTRVERMGGVYSNVFHDAVTHLVAEVRFTTYSTEQFYLTSEH